MTVIKHGNPEKMKRPPFKFTCKRCGCIYEAEKDELKKEPSDGPYSGYDYTNCPDCNQRNSVDYDKNKEAYSWD